MSKNHTKQRLKNTQYQSKKRQAILAYSALFLSTLIWALATVVIKITLNYIPLFTFLFYRFLIVGLVLLPFVIKELQKVKVPKSDLPTLVLLGILGQSGILLIFAGIKYTTTIDAAILGAIAPLFIIAGGHYFYKDKLTPKLKKGMVLALIGTLIVALEPIFAPISHNAEAIINTQTYSTTWRIIGNILVLIYNVSFAGYIILSKEVMGEKSPVLTGTLKEVSIKPLKGQYTPFLHTALSFYIALGTFLPFAVLEKVGYFGATPTAFSIAEITIVPLMGLLYMALISSIIAYTVFQWGLDRTSASDTGMFSYLGTVLTLPFSFVLLGELPTGITLLGTFLIAAGVVIAEKKG